MSIMRTDPFIAHGSRVEAAPVAAGTDIDFAVRVSPEKFDQMVQDRFGTPNSPSAKERTMLNAQEFGKLDTGEAGLRSTKKALEAATGMDVDLSVIRQGGSFDQTRSIPVPKPTAKPAVPPAQAAGVAASAASTQNKQNQ